MHQVLSGVLAGTLLTELLLEVLLKAVATFQPLSAYAHKRAQFCRPWVWPACWGTYRA